MLKNEKNIKDNDKNELMVCCVMYFGLLMRMWILK